jgi:exopolysaccharide biosynthesis polyprenyl glycosylphosphotransferase
VSLVAVNRAEQKTQHVEWARLIPGENPAIHQHTKKGPKSVQASGLQAEFPPAFGEVAHPQRRLAVLKPQPLQSPVASRWLRSMGADWALVSLNWLIVGAALVPLRELFPRVWSFRYAAGAPLSLLGIAVLHAALITLIGYVEGLHVGGSDLRRQSLILGKSVFWATFLLCAAYFLEGAPWTISGLIVIAGVLHVAALWAWRWKLREYGGPARGETRNVLIIGAGAAGRRVAASIAEQHDCGRNICGFLDDERPRGNGVIGGVADLARIARSKFVDEIILAAQPDSGAMQRLLSEAQRLRLDVQIVPDLCGCSPVGNEIERLGRLPLICVHAEQFPVSGLCVKRLADILGAGSALLVLSPLLLVIAGLIKLDSPGPVFYCAQRVGRKGRLFRCYKFRTMVRNADDLKLRLRHNNDRAGPFFKMSCDPRLTRIGPFLRRYSIDELPQLWNVLRGEMSLVGPRPHPLDDVAGYEIEHLSRLDVTPGITGLWQVTARRDPSFHRGLELDREYIRRWSLGLDARILFKTFIALMQGSGQ